MIAEEWAAPHNVGSNEATAAAAAETATSSYRHVSVPIEHYQLDPGKGRDHPSTIGVPSPRESLMAVPPPSYVYPFEAEPALPPPPSHPNFCSPSHYHSYSLHNSPGPRPHDLYLPVDPQQRQPYYSYQHKGEPSQEGSYPPDVEEDEDCKPSSKRMDPDQTCVVLRRSKRKKNPSLEVDDERQSTVPPVSYLRPRDEAGGMAPFGSDTSPYVRPKHPYEALLREDARTRTAMSDSNMVGQYQGVVVASPRVKEPPKVRSHYGPSVADWENSRTTRQQRALETWYKRLDDLWEYYNEYGDTKVPQKWPQNPALGIWVNKQRQEHKLYVAGEPSSLTKSKVAALQEIDFYWGKQKGDFSWNARFAELVAYKQKKGDCLVPTKSKVYPALGRWVSAQRAAYAKWKRRESSSMTEERSRRLDELGFMWTMVPNYGER